MFDKFEKITDDPSTFSFREEALDLEQENLSVYIDKKTGEKFHRIENQAVSSQRFIALVCKGIINVSDIVKVGDHYYSHEQNFDNIKPSKENIITEMRADIFLFRIIFLDDDHKYLSEVQSERIREQQKYLSVIEHVNLRINETNNKLAFFDFGAASINLQTHFKENLKSLEEATVRALKIFTGDPNENIVLDILKKKVRIFLDMFSEEAFERFKGILKRSGIMHLTDSQQGILFENLKLRLQALDNVLSKTEQ